MTNQSILNAVELLILSLSIAVIVGIFARQRRMPYTVGLVLVGLIFVLGYPTIRQLESLPFLGNMLNLLDELIHLNDQLVRQIILGLMLPPIIFEAAFHLHFDDLRQDVGPITLFAIPGVIITTLLVGGVVAWGIKIDFATAAVFGALIAATDPVAVVALFRALGVPRRLRVLLEGESLLNDGTAIVVFGIALSISNGESLQLTSSIIDFVITVGGGLLIGIVFGWVISVIIQRLDDYLIETALIFILAYSTYITAENAGVSGVLAVVAAGLLSGNIGLRSMSATTRIVVENFWEFTAFIANSLVFLLIGLVVDPRVLWSNKWIILLAILAVLAARAIVVYGFSAVVRNIPFRWQVVLHWGGLRGAITLALALSLSNDDLRAMAFGVVIFTLLVQGTSMGSIVRKLNLAKRSPERESYQRRKAQTLATRKAEKRLESLYRDGIISIQTKQRIEPILENHIDELTSGIKEILQTEPSVAAEELDTAWREVLRAERTTLDELFADGAITEEYFWEMVSSVDAALQSGEINWMELEDLKAGLNIKEEAGE
ncbi:MAG: cation:proton antiporter [Anaerolineales bacterium]|jgi:CPA1 family monovalent cation:H+ antiporter